jgi:hypothetical protein
MESYIGAELEAYGHTTKLGERLTLLDMGCAKGLNCLH